MKKKKDKENQLRKEMFETDILTAELPVTKGDKNSAKKETSLSKLSEKAHSAGSLLGGSGDQMTATLGGNPTGDDATAMKAYSLAVAQSAENNEPDEPIEY